MPPATANIAIVGCGFVADMYLKTLEMHPELRLVGVFDHDEARAQQFAEFHDVHRYASCEQLLNDDRVQIVANLTNPSSHYEISRQALTAGKHVYSEKPLAMEMVHARELVALAASKGLLLSSAPCSLLSESAQTMYQALREQRIGPVRAAYAEMDDGLLHIYQYRKWISDSGAPWPYRDEFEVGCTLEHAGYCLTWLAGFFGPATSVTAFSSLQVPDKLPEEELPQQAPDFSVAAIQFASGVVARVTCSILAPHDHRLMIVGDEGILCTDDTWLYRSPVYIRRWKHLRRRTFLSPLKDKLPLVGKHLPQAKYRGASRMDFCRGMAEMAAALAEQRDCRLSSQFSLHVTELSLAITHAGTAADSYRMTTDFQPVPPMAWAS